MQFSLFGAEAAEADLTDLDGLMLAGGDWVRTAAPTEEAIAPSVRTGQSEAPRLTAARLSVLVTDSWRVDALVAELAGRGLDCDTAPAPGGLIAVRSEISQRLGPQAHRWTRGASLQVPPGFVLSALGLRLWAIAAGRREEAGYLLGTGQPDGSLHRAAGRELSALGVSSIEVSVKGRPGWRVTSAKRLRRLAELLGEAPVGAGVDWPG